MPLESLRLDDLGAHLGLRVEGDGSFAIAGIAGLEHAGPGDLSFVRSSRYAALLSDSRAGALIAPPGVQVGDRPVLRSRDPGLDFSRAVRWFMPETPIVAGIHPTAVIAEDARVDSSACIGAHCVLAAGAFVGPRSVLFSGVTLYHDASIGADCRIHAGCVLREATTLGDRVVLHPNVVLGADGFAYLGDEGGGLSKVPQVGRVVIGIDNLVQIGHNCTIGEQVIIVAQVGLAGSTIVEDGAVILGQAGAAGHLTIGAGAIVGPQSGLHKDVAPGTRVLGNPQQEGRGFYRNMAALGRVRGLLRRVRAIERRLGMNAADDEPDRS